MYVYTIFAGLFFLSFRYSLEYLGGRCGLVRGELPSAINEHYDIKSDTYFKLNNCDVFY